VPAQERAGSDTTDKPRSAISIVRVFQSNGKLRAVAANDSRDGHRYQIADEGSTTIGEDVVILHYDESYEVRRDVLLPGRPVMSTFLVFPETHEDLALRSIDRTREFAEVEYTRSPRLEGRW
jgi:hypothetical protein